MLVPMKEIVDAAYAGGYAVPALPSWSELLIRAEMEAADATNSPVIFLSFNHPDAKEFHELIGRLAEKANVPVAICLDHSRSFEDCILGIKNGCTAIMADRSESSFEQNVAEVSELAKIAHAVNVSIEAELGHVGQGDNYAHDGVSMLTKPEDAKRFYDLTGVDALAVAVGTAHGVYKGTPHIDFERLRDINAACGRPLVLHGGSGSGDDNISKACTMGITKVNIVTDVFVTMNKTICELALPDDQAKFFLRSTQKAVSDFAKHTFEMTGCIGKVSGKNSANEATHGNVFHE